VDNRPPNQKILVSTELKTDITNSLPVPGLRSELAKHCLPESRRDDARKLAWVNSICLLFLVVGLTGAKPADTHIKPLAPLDDAIPALLEPIVAPPAQPVEQNEQPTDEEQPPTPQIVVVTPESPAINFSVPTIGSVVVPNAIAKAPPLQPLRAPVLAKAQSAVIQSTGTGGDRPHPPYPKLALEQREQGSVVLAITVDTTGVITAVQIKESSSSPILDRSALDFVKRHWVIPPGATTRIYEATITYRIQ
jgi:TonB family protein